MYTYSGDQLKAAASEDQLLKLITEDHMAKIKDVTVQAQVKNMLNTMFGRLYIDINVSEEELD